MANSCVLFVTDNAALVDIINKQTSKHKQVMILIRDLLLITYYFELATSQTYRIVVPIASPVYRWRNSRNSRRRRTNFQQQYQRTYSRRVGHSRERLVRLGLGYWLSQLTDPPLPYTKVALFISYLSAKQLAPSTITTYLSVLSYVHKSMGRPDPTKSFLISKVVNGPEPPTCC